ncbi:MAG: hypothetical protein GWP19_05660 [Planctomycetia bacterium]|nr:hypothetical protein [Planctomycetia bacterium]
MINRISYYGILAFFIVLLTMPLGHAAMILMEHLFGINYIYYAAIILGIIGFFLLIIGYTTANETKATFYGLFAGLAIWTGWIEFSFIYYAKRYHIQPLIENGEIVTKPEYLLLPSSIGFLVVILLNLLLNSNIRCNFFNWFKRRFKMQRGKSENIKSRSVTMGTAIELIMILWTFYIVLLLAYDNSIFGDSHPVTYIIAFGSLLWSAYLFIKLLRIKKLGFAIRYAIPTVIIFWNFVEILGRWDIYKEIWVHPLQYWFEMLLVTIIFIALIIISSYEKTRQIQ